jgi:cytochrome P450
VPLIARLREDEPVYWIPGLDAWLVSRHEDVRFLFSDPRVAADPRVSAHYEKPSDPGAARWLAEMPFRSASATGQSFGRRLVSAALTPRAIARLETSIREVVESFAAPLHGRSDRVDLVGEFAVPVSTTAIGRILGVSPKDDETRFRRLAVEATAIIRPFVSPEKRQRAERAVGEMGDYVAALVEDRRALPREDLISDLLAAAKARDGSSSAVAENITRVIAGLVSAGTGTTSVACGRALRTLFHHPDQLHLLRRDRSLVPNAVEELLRYDSGILFMPRYVIEDVVLGERTLRQGQLVLLSLMGANRDPRVFSEPDRLDLRRNVKEAVSLGYGMHYCPGASIARMELRLMIDAALDFLPPDARLAEADIRWSNKGVMSQIKTLPVDFSPRESGQN